MAKLSLRSTAKYHTLTLSLVLASALVARVPEAAVPPSAQGSRVAVATDHSEATQAAFATLAAGGNAADAAVTAALTLGVVSPVASGLGGGGFAIVYTARDRKVTVLDFREVAPQVIDTGALLARMRRDPSAPRGASFGVPGEPAGLELLSRRFGKRSLAAAAAPAAAVARRGFFLGKNMADWAARLRGLPAASPELGALYFPGGTAAPFGTLVRNPALARTLDVLGAQGAEPFYRGAVAEKLVAAARGAGSKIEASDMAAYRVRERAPLARTIDGRTIVTMPAPSAGGLMLLEAAGMFGAGASSPLKEMGFGSSAYLHTMAEVMRGALADRARVVGDPDREASVDAQMQKLLEPDALTARRARIDPNKTNPAPAFKSPDHGTSHVVVGDAEGNVVSLTTTVNAPFGAWIVAGDTGIVLNDELDDFSGPDDAKPFGVTGPGPNAPRPGARPVSSMTPVIVLENGAPILAAGGSGGLRIATSVTQATMCRLVFGLDPSACVSAPRVHLVGAAPEVIVDPDVPEDVRAGLRARGEQPKEESPGTTAVQMIAWDRSGAVTRILAASDPRKYGFAAAQ
jgi:gamma-glutamyltranspeptidase/glutathione hydrolase